MPTQIYCEFPAKLIRNKETIEKKFNIKMTNNAKVFTLTGTAEDEYLATEFVEAINAGFTTLKAFLIKEENMTFQSVNIKKFTKSGNLERIRARVIGRRGKALSTLETLTNCYLNLKDNEVGIIGLPEDVANAAHAIQRIVEGSKHANVYANLEKNIAAGKHGI